MKRTFHMGIDIRGVLSWKDKELKKLFKSEDEKPYYAQEIRNYLYDKLLEGFEVLPLGKQCDNFDKKVGCLGHEVKTITEEIK